MDFRLEPAYPTFPYLVPSVERIAAGFAFAEGPVWRGDELLFSDIPNNRTVRYRPSTGGAEITTFRYPSGKANGLTLDREGRLLACESSGRRVSRIGQDGTAETLVDSYEGKRLNAPNDIVVRSDGSIYFTDPPYGVRFKPENAGPSDSARALDFYAMTAQDGKELPFDGVYRVDPAGKLHVVADDFEGPNGLAFSPDERTLYVDDSARSHIRSFDVAADGSLSNGRIWAELKRGADEGGAADGMKVDRQGNVYCTGPGGIWIFDLNARFLGRIVLPESAANLAWGDADWQTLYITAQTSLYRMRMLATGMPVGMAAR